MKKKSPDKKLRLKKSLILTWIIPHWLIFISFALWYFTGNYDINYDLFTKAFIYIPIIAVCIFAHRRWVLYFSETHFCTFYFWEGIKKYNLHDIVEIWYNSSELVDKHIHIYFIKNGTLKRAIFDIHHKENIDEVLTFLKEKVSKNVIFNTDFSNNFRKKKRRYRQLALQNTPFSERENEDCKISYNLKRRRWKLLFLIAPLAWFLFRTDYVQLQVKGSRLFIITATAGSGIDPTSVNVWRSLHYVAEHKPEKEVDELLQSFLDTTNLYWATQYAALRYVAEDNKKFEYLDKLQTLKTYKEKQRAELALSQNLDMEEVIKRRYDNSLNSDLRGLTGDIEDLEKYIKDLEKAKETLHKKAVDKK